MPPKKDERLNRLENSVNLLMEIMATRNIRQKDAEIQTTTNEQKCAEIQTIIMQDTKETQTIFRKNITERGIQVKARCNSVGTNTETMRETKINTETQTDKIISVADIFLNKVTQKVLPQLQKIQDNWIEDEIRNNTFSSNNIREHFDNINIRRQFNTNDVVNAIIACTEMIVATYGQETDYETDYQTEDESDNNSYNSVPNHNMNPIRSNNINSNSGNNPTLYYKIKQGL